jgi:hypothetical protein
MVRVLRTIGFNRDYRRGQGAYLFDDEGHRYLDLLSGWGLFALGMHVIKLLPPLVINNDERGLASIGVRRGHSDCHQVPGAIWSLGTSLAHDALAHREGRPDQEPLPKVGRLPGAPNAKEF